MARLREVNGNIYNDDYMTFDECIDLITVLSHSQGAYIRLLESISELDEENLEELKNVWESKKFTDSLDFILYLEG